MDDEIYPEPIFAVGPTPIQRRTVSEIISFLSNQDQNFRPDKLIRFIQEGNDVFQNITPQSIQRFQDSGLTGMMAGLPADLPLREGLRALNRVGFYKIAGDVTLRMIPNNKGQEIPSFQAPTLFCEKIGEPIYVGIMNVGTLVNDEGFGFNFRSEDELYVYNQRLEVINKQAFLTNLIDKVFYVSSQYFVRNTRFGKLKHTVWMQVPTSAFLLLHGYYSAPIDNSERLQLFMLH